MNKKQRSDVVELLRCAADRLLGGASVVAPLTDTARELCGDSYGMPRELATCRDLMAEVAPFWWDASTRTEIAFATLEAALRVEDGEWP